MASVFRALKVKRFGADDPRGLWDVVEDATPLWESAMPKLS